MGHKEKIWFYNKAWNYESTVEQKEKLKLVLDYLRLFLVTSTPWKSDVKIL